MTELRWWISMKYCVFIESGKESDFSFPGRIAQPLYADNEFYNPLHCQGSISNSVQQYCRQSTTIVCKSFARTPCIAGSGPTELLTLFRLANIKAKLFTNLITCQFVHWANLQASALAHERGHASPHIVDSITCQCWHQLLFLIHIGCWWSLFLDARQLGRHLVQQLLMAMKQLLVDTKQLLSRSARSLDCMKHVFVVVPETLTRRFINSWLTVDDHETAAKQRKQKANRKHGRSVCALSIHMQCFLLLNFQTTEPQTRSSPRLTPLWLSTLLYACMGAIIPGAA